MEIRLFSRKLLLPFVAFLLLAVSELPSSSKAEDGFWFTRSQSDLGQLWGGVLGCAEGADSSAIRNRLDDSENANEESVPTGTSRDYSQCGKHALRNTGSRILVNTVEDVVRSGGVALLDENFRLDSSLGWVWGESVTGELDAVVPVPASLLDSLPGLRRAGGEEGEEKEIEHALFIQPGLVFWPGLEEEKRIDGNLGLVYRNRIIRNVIAGGSLFYDYDFKQGHQRLGVGIDMQSDAFQAGLNYYHPLNDWTEGRTDYEEQALQGGDLRLGLAWARLRLNASVGVWRFEGEEEEKTKWRPSFGADAGIRILPGVFLEAGYERHDGDDSFGSRWSTGLVFRFSLPGLDGGTLSPNSYAPNLLDPVKREKRILYEEREAVPPVRLATPVDESGQPLSPTSTIEEGGTVTIAGELESLSQPVMLNLVIDEDATSADLGSDFNYGHKVYTLDAGTGQQSAPDTTADCPELTCTMMVPAGVTRFDVEIGILDDGNAAPREIPEEIVLQIEVPEEHQRMLRSSETTTVTIRAHGNTIEFAPDAATTLAENNVTMGVEVSVNIDMASPTAITLNVEPGGTATAGADYTILPSTLTIPAGEDSATLTLQGINNEIGEGSKTITLALSGDLPEGWDFGPVTDPANPPATITHSMVLLDDDLAVGFAIPSGAETFNPARVFEENPTNGMQHGVTVRVESTQQAPTEGFDLAWEVRSMEGDDQVDSTSGAVNFSSGDSHKEFTLMIKNESTPEAETPVTVRLSTPTSLPTGWNFGVQEYTFTIETSDAFLGFASRDPVMADEGETLTFEVTSTFATPSTGIPMIIGFNEGNAAAEDINFQTTFTIPAGQSSHSFTVEVIDDSTAEDAETYNIFLGLGDDFPHSWGAVGGSRAITINPSDRTIGFASSAPLVLLEEGSATMVTIVVQPPPAVDIIIPLSITDGAGNNSYAPSASSTLSNNAQTGLVLTYRQGKTSETVTITPVSDTDDRQEEITFSINGARSNFPDGYALADNSTLAITIIDDEDSSPVMRTVSFSKPSSRIAEGGTREIGGVMVHANEGVQLEIVPELKADVMIPLTVQATDADGYTITAQHPMGATYQNGMVTFDYDGTSGSSDTVTLIASAVSDSDTTSETVTVTIGALPPNYRLGTNSTWTIEIEDAGQ